MLRIAKRYSREPGGLALRQFARRHLGRLHKQQHGDKPYVSVLYGLSHRQELLSGGEIPEEYDKKTIQQLLRRPCKPARYDVLQRGERLLISARNSVATDEELSVQYGQPLAQFTAVQNIVIVNQQPVVLPDPDNPDSSPVPLIPPSEQTPLRIDTGQERLTIKTLKKPDWADAIYCDEQGLSVIYRQHRITYPAWATRVDADEKGLFADVCIDGVTQRLRAILSGTFMMGSPPDEAERDDDEDYHQVILTQGYWLADTACTQALWQAVMGENPSDFQDDPENPVESVSWLDVQVFLKKLNQQIPGLQVRLPSEAQWEYACRAGT
ncbi:MAG TPA: hypothetical protein ENJ35_00480, partial [Gammaproteobacteria bacterium]|nr:hypothetical protein [Gammaproteobacteria bacterium]